MEHMTWPQIEERLEMAKGTIAYRVYHGIPLDGPVDGGLSNAQIQELLNKWR